MTRRVSRRTLLGGAAAASVATASGVSWAAIAARGRGGAPGSAGIEPTSSAGPTVQPAPSPTLPPPPRGGRHVIAAPGRLNIDTFDAQLTGESSVVEILGRTHSRLVQWADQANPTLGPDLAERWETPEPRVYLFHLDPKAKWHDKQPINGRPVTAEDVVAHFKRSLEIAGSGKAPLAQRYQMYSIESVDSPEAGVARFRSNDRDPYFLDTLASEFALIQAPEAVANFEGIWSTADSDHVIGSGPWTFDWADDGVKFSAVRHGHRQPNIDELHVTEPHDVAQRFVTGELDEAIIRDRRDAALIRSRFDVAGTAQERLEDIQRAASLDQVFESRRMERQLVVSSFAVDEPPWNNPALITAISGALNRSQLARRLFGGRAVAASPAPLPFADGDGISAERLKLVPGYGPMEAGAPPSPEWRAQWEAAGGPGLGPITIDFPSVFDPLYSASSVVIDMLNEALGPQFRAAVETYTTISKRVIEGYYGNGRAAFWFGWGPPLASPMGERYVAETYGVRSAGQRVTGGGGIYAPTPDEVLRVTETGYLGIVPWLRQYAEVFRRPLAPGPAPSPFWAQHMDVSRARLA